MSDSRVKELEAERPFIEELRHSSGAPALSLGVFHDSITVESSTQNISVVEISHTPTLPLTIQSTILPPFQSVSESAP